MVSKRLSLFSIAFIIITFFDHNKLFVQAESQSSSDVFVLPDTGEVYSSNDYENAVENDWTDILYKEKKMDRQEYIEYEENLKRMNNIHALPPVHSEDRKLPIHFQRPDERPNNNIEKINQYKQYNLNNYGDQDNNNRFLPMDMRHPELEPGPFDDDFIDEILEEEGPEYGYDFENLENVNVNPVTSPRDQLSNNDRILVEPEQPERLQQPQQTGISTNNITPPNYAEKNSQPFINEENNHIDPSYSFKPDVSLSNPSVDTFKLPANKNQPADISNIDDYNDDLSSDEVEILDKIMGQKDVQEAMLKKGTLSDTNLKSILYSVYNSTNDDSLHSSSKNNNDFEKEKQVSIPTSGNSDSTIPENSSFKSNVNNAARTSSIPKKDIFEMDNQNLQVNPMDGLNSKIQDNLEEKVVQDQLFIITNGGKRIQQYGPSEAIKSKGDSFQKENIPNRPIPPIPSIYPSQTDDFRAQFTESAYSTAMAKSVIAPPSMASVTAILEIKMMENTSFVSSYTSGSYPTESSTAFQINLESENPVNDTLESSLLQSGNLKNNTLEPVISQPGTGKTFDPSVQIKNPNGSWSPSCKNVHKGMYCLELDGKGSTVVECFGENIGFQFSCGNNMFCYTVSAYDVDCRARCGFTTLEMIKWPLCQPLQIQFNEPIM